MSLATRCPVCQTVFRVVQDQLKVSEGWVRCGRCAKVFNAFEGLFDLEREFPALRSPTPSQRVLEDLATRNRQPKPQAEQQDDFDTRANVRDASAAPTAAANPPMAPTVVAQRRAAAPLQQSTTPAPAPSAPAAAPVATTAASSETTPFASRMRRDAATASRDEGATIPPAASRIAAPTSTASNSERPAAAPAATVSPAPAPAVKPAARASAEVAIRDEPTPVPGTAEGPDSATSQESFEALFRSDGELAQPDTAADGVDIMLEEGEVEPASLDDAVDSRLLTFVQQADRAERWRRPWVRAVMAVAVLALTVLLAAQLTVARRDAVVAQWPGSRSLVQSLCAPLDCRIEPLRRIDQLSVDSSGLTRIDDGPVYRLVLVLRNRGDTALLMPAIDLSLTDAAGVLVARRMLSAADLGTARNTIAAGQELPLQALLMSGERALTGYTIEIFYP